MMECGRTEARLLIAVALCFGAIACGPEKPEDRASAAVGAIYTSAEQAVAEQLRDPSSAEFDPSDLRFADVATGVIVCGTVNAKNGFGGYIGKTNWIALAKPPGDDGIVHAQAMIAGASTKFWPSWRKMCRHNRVGISEMEVSFTTTFRNMTDQKAR